MEAIEAEVLDLGKRDAKGRRVFGEHERNRLLDEYEKSGLTQKEFARREGVNVHTLVAWLGRRRKMAAATDRANKPVRFQEVSLTSPAASVLEVHLPDGTVLKGASARDLATLALALAEVTRC